MQISYKFSEIGIYTANLCNTSIKKQVYFCNLI